MLIAIILGALIGAAIGWLFGKVLLFTIDGIFFHKKHFEK